MSGDFSAAFARVSGPVSADCPAGGCDHASAGQSHIRQIKSPATVRPAVIFITAYPHAPYSTNCKPTKWIAENVSNGIFRVQRTSASVGVLAIVTGVGTWILKTWLTFG